jgi:outer membrane immunogenic protein
MFRNYIFCFDEVGHQMKKIALAATAVSILFAGAASAADLPARTYTKAPVVATAPVFSWTGFYIGAHGGAAWSGQYATSADPASDLATGRLNSSARAIAGVHAGYNWEVAQRFVLGIEADATWTDLSTSAFDTNRVGGAVLAGGVTFTDRVNWLATVRGRAGFAVAPQLLLYVTGGGAWGDVNNHTVDIHTAGPAFPATFDFSGSRTGWVAGAGGEWAFNSNWLARLEYLHYELGGASATGIPRVGVPAELSTFTSSTLKIDSVRAGISYKFSPAAVVAKY